MGLRRQLWIYRHTSFCSPANLSLKITGIGTYFEGRQNYLILFNDGPGMVRGARRALDGYGRPPDVTALDPSLPAARGVCYIHIPAPGVTILVS